MRPLLTRAAAVDGALDDGAALVAEMRCGLGVSIQLFEALQDLVRLVLIAEAIGKHLAEVWPLSSRITRSSSAAAWRPVVSRISLIDEPKETAALSYAL